jgi:ATP-binding cassette subfamily B protein
MSVSALDAAAHDVASPRADIRWLWRFIRGHSRAASGAIGCGVVAGIATALEPYLIGQIIDHVQRGVSLQQIAADVVLLLLLSIISLMGFFGQRTYSGTVAYSVNFDIRRTLFDNLVTLDQKFYQHYPTGDLISRMHSDLDMIWRLMAIGFTRIGSATFGLISTFVLLALINVPLTLLVFVVLTISTSFQLRAGKILTPVFERVQDQAGVQSALVQDVFSGIQTIKTAAREEDAARKFHDENLEYRRRWLHFKRRNEPVGMLPNMISELTAGTVVLFGGVMTLQGMLTVGNFAQFLLYLSLISSVLLQLGTIYQRYQQTRGALQRLTPLLRHAEIANAPDAKALPRAQGEIEFDQVSLEIDGVPLLRDISLRIPAGQVVAFVGPTGCGKSLLVNLLARVQDPTDGTIRIDGSDIRQIDLDDLRRAIAYVPQSTFLFSRPLHENVRMGRDDLPEEGLEAAIRISRVSNDLPQLPRGVETMVGEKGVMLSGGQKQRVAIARAIVRDPAILVLDDALSSVDTRTAADILSELRQVLRTRTSLIIAHRIATVKDADHIVVMSEGEIVEQGTHADLITRGGLYAQMVERELSTEQESAHV